MTSKYGMIPQGMKYHRSSITPTGSSNQWPGPRLCNLFIILHIISTTTRFLFGNMGVMNLLQSKFAILEMELTAQEGAISDQDYEDKIEEAFRQLWIDLDND